MKVIEIYYGMPADFGCFGKGYTQHVIRRYAVNKEWEIKNLKRKGAKEIRVYDVE